MSSRSESRDVFLKNHASTTLSMTVVTYGQFIVTNADTHKIKISIFFREPFNYSVYSY